MNLQSQLAQFTGTEHYYRFSPFNQNLVMTDGVKYLAEKAACFWLLDIVASLDFEPSCKGQEFITCRLKKEGEGAKFTADNGNRKVLYTQEIPYTDFPIDEVTLYRIDNVVLLPSEY